MEWAGGVCRVALANHAALTRLVTDADFDLSKAGAKELKAVIVDVDGTFWPLLGQFIKLMQPLRLAIHTLQGDQAKLSDVMGAFVRIHDGQEQFVASEACTFSSDTKSALRRAPALLPAPARACPHLPTPAHTHAHSPTWMRGRTIFQRRFLFLYHPIHLVAFALDPRYAKKCAAAPSVLRSWIKKLHNKSTDDAALVNDFGSFVASFDDREQADIWTPEAAVDPVAWWRAWGREFPPAVVWRSEPARHPLALLDVVRQLRRAGQHIEALAWRREILWLEGLERCRLGLPVGLLLVDLIILLTLDLVAVHPRKSVASLALPGENRLARGHSGP